ncbi:flagellar hook-associated protein FlgK [Oleispirillum naphthae]|uniref:flagellar hook-associated protein FlgK n=1 Tax=Oleispirillum naphthae TaxID=2838853 RepID=UPI0030823D62
MSITLALGAAMSGLSTAQQGLDSISRNIANVNTVGYTRKVFVQESQVLAGRGVGVRARGLERTVDEALLRDIRREAAVAGSYSVQNTYYSRIQDLFGSPSDNSSIAHAIQSLANQFETLGVDVSSVTQALNTVQSAADVAEQLNTMTTALQNLRLEADRGLESDVDSVNGLLSHISTLNAEIVRNQNTFQDTGDLEDQRDQALTDLSALMNFSYFKRDSGEVILLTAQGRSLLDKNPVPLTHQAVTQTAAGLTYEAGNFNGISAGGADITADISGGEMAGYIQMRDTTLPALQSELDELATQLKDTLNAVHNRGTPYPGLAQNSTGTRTFIDSAGQSVGFGPGDVKLVLYNADGTQAAQSSIKDELTALNGGTPTSSGSIDDIVDALNAFFTDYKGGTPTAWASVDTDGHLAIEIPGTESVGFAMRDEDTTGAAADITVSFDAAGGDGIYESVSKGFSAFFGLNDFYVDPTANCLYDSKIVSTSWKASTASAMSFGIAGDTAISTVNISQNDTVSDIAAKINADSALAAANITASVVKEGSGVRLRILQNDGEEMVVSETTAQGVLTRLGMAPSKSGAAASLEVREDLTSDSSLLSSGILQYNTDTGQYGLASADNSIANAMAEAFTSAASFAEAGKIAAGTQSFSAYATSILSQTSSEASRAASRSETQQTLTESLALKQGQISGVNLDEELTQLMIYQQAYTAAARVISTTQSLFDVLNNIVK